MRPDSYEMNHDRFAPTPIVRKILIAVTGSLGDLNPMLAVGEHLLASGVDVTVAAFARYERNCVSNGFGFRPITGPIDYLDGAHCTRSMLENNEFAEYLERLNLEQLAPVFEQFLAAAQGSDLILAPMHVPQGQLIADKIGASYLGCAFVLNHFRAANSGSGEGSAKVSAASMAWKFAVRKLREDYQIERPARPVESLLAGSYKLIGLLPKFLTSHLRLRSIEMMGYAEHRQADRMVQDSELLDFCDERTVAFSFGSFADICDPDYFFQESVAACRKLNLKCIYLSQQLTKVMLESGADDVLVRGDVAPGAVFPLVGSVVHHGGMGTLVSACKSLKPMIIVPFFLDQPLNAVQMQSQIGAPTIPAKGYGRDSAVEALRHVIGQRESMTVRLSALMTDYQDGAMRAAEVAMGVLKGRETGRAPGSG
jgi:vancomycin aglycone glucosyltransferase